MTIQSKLLSFASEVLEQHGALVEPAGPAMDCLLPSELAEELGVDEAIQLLTPLQSEETPLVYGGTLLDGIIELAQGKGRFAHIELNELSSRKGGLQVELARSVHLLNGKSDIGKTSSSHVSYLILQVRYQANAGDLSESGRMTVVCNETTLAPAPWLIPMLARQSYKDSSPPNWRTSFEEVAATLKKICEQSLEEQTLSFWKRLRHKISVKKRRLERLHRRERKEILGLYNSELPQSEKDELFADLREAEEEFVAVCSTIPQELQARISMVPFAALRVTMPVSKVDYTIRKRKESKTLQWIWNPLLEDFEALLCEKCQCPSFEFGLSDKMEAICSSCLNSEE